MTPQIKKYRFSLYNKSDSLNLVTKSKEIKEALSDLIREKNGLIKCLSLEIGKNSIEILVKENSLEWHKKFPSTLKNNYNMGVFCKQDNPNAMFRIETLS